VVDPAPPPEGKAAEYNSFNARSLLMIGSLYVVQFVKYGWFTARYRTRTDGPSTTCAAPPADTRRVVLARSI